MVAQIESVLAPRNTILHGHTLDLLRTLPDACVQAIVTSPPYLWKRNYDNPPLIWGGVSTCRHIWKGPQPPRNIHQKPQSNISVRAGAGEVAKAQHQPMGTFCKLCHAWRGNLGDEPTIALYIEHLVSIFREAHRVLRHDGTLWVNIGDGYSNDTKWLGGSAPTKNTASKAGIYTGQTVKRTSSLPPKSRMLIPARFALAMVDDGWVLRNEIVWEKPNALCESVTDRCAIDHEFIYLFTKRPHYFFDAEAIKEPVTGGAHRRGQGVHPKAEAASAGIRANRSFSAATTDLVATRNAREIWRISTVGYSEAHFATFPPELAERCIAAGSSPYACERCGAPWQRIVEKTPMVVRHGPKSGGYGSRTTDGISGTMIAPARSPTAGWRPTCKCPNNQGTGHSLVLDPFSGVATVALVARRMGRDYLGCELNAQYIALGTERLLRDTLPPSMQQVPIHLIPPTLFDDPPG